MGFNTQVITQSAENKTRPATQGEIIQAFDAIINRPHVDDIFVITGINHWITDELNLITLETLQTAKLKAATGNTIAFWPGKKHWDVLSAQIPTMDKVFSNNAAFCCLAITNGEERPIKIFYEHELIKRMGIARMHGHKGRKSSVPMIPQTELSQMPRECTVVVSGYPDDCAQRKPVYVFTGVVDPRENYRFDSIELSIYETSDEAPVTVVRSYSLEQGVARLSKLTFCNHDRVSCSKLALLLAFKDTAAISLSDQKAMSIEGSIVDRFPTKIPVEMLSNLDEEITVDDPVQLGNSQDYQLTINYSTLESSTKIPMNIPYTFSYDRSAIQKLQRFNEWVNLGGNSMTSIIHSILDNSGLIT